MLHRDERNVDAGHAPDLARPLAGADHDLVAGDAALVGDDGAHAAVLDLDAGDASRPRAIVTPALRAPLASDMAMSDGEAWPSVGRKAAPTTSSTCISGHRSCASFGVRRCISRPKDVAVVACRLTSVQRSGLQASRKPPLRFQPVARPVSCSSRS